MKYKMKGHVVKFLDGEGWVADEVLECVPNIR
jgi:hypothetical protein